MEELICRERTIHSVIFQNAENGYTVLRLLTEEGEVVTVVGCIPCAAPGEGLSVTGTWERHPQHGEQLRASEVERRLPEDEAEMFSYLSSGVLKGVGPATARNMVDRFGLETFDVLETAPERLTTLKGVTARRAQEIGEAFRQHMGLRRLMAFLARYELPPVLAMRLRRQYGDAALEKLRQDPYLLVGDECGVAFSVADEIAMSMGFQPDQHFTQPPPRYTDASLIRAMEENGIGRPSTYAPTVSTILDREYVIKDGKYLRTTPLGEVVNGLMEDKFGDNGIVSVVIGKKDGAALDIELWLMSCRVLKRDMESAMLDSVVEACKECGIRTIMGYYYPTAKNAMVKEFYQTMGFEKMYETDTGVTIWRYEIPADYENKNTVISVKSTSKDVPS